VAVRSNERAAAALGIDVDGVKVFAFAVAAALAGTGGILLAFRQTFLDYGAFEPFASISVVVYSVIGGIGFVIGGLLAGPFIVGGLGAEFVRAIGFEPHNIEWLTGLVLVAMLLAQPDGLAREHIVAARAVRDRVRRGTKADPPVDGQRRRLRAAGSESGAAKTNGRVSDAPRTVSPGDVLSVEHVTVRFGGVLALDDVTLQVAPGEVVGLIGPNGAGKTTLIDSISGFVRASQDCKITLGSEDLRASDPAARARSGVGRSFQSLELFNDMTVRENLLTACEPWKRSYYLTDLFRTRSTTLTPTAVAAVEEFELGEFLDRPVDELPHATQRLVGIARAVAATPKILLLDEPAAGLSEAASSELGHLIRLLAQRQGIGVLLVEHDVPLVMRTCDRVSVLNFGQIIASGTPDEISQNSDVVAAYLGGERATVRGQA
jgi:sulfate-transporting ATPase